MNVRFALVLALGLSSVATVAQTETAEAGRHRYSAGGRARVHVHAPAVSSGGVSVTYARPGYRHRTWAPRSWSVGGHIWVGGGYYPRYRTYRPYYYTPVPSYYGTYYSASYYPVAPVATVVLAPRPELPKFGIGLFAGGVSVEDRNESSDVGILGRLRLTQGLLIEGELGKQTYEADTGRVDRRMGASLVYEIGAYNKLAPYVLAGMGVQQADVDGAYTTTQNFGELGIGLRWAVTPKFHVLFDVRAGSRNSVSSNRDELQTDSGIAARTITPPAPDSDESEEYTRGRLSAVLYF
ncbi:MAG: porin family protein [Myxococcota bacterium]|nr:porin family protein [Myxococcota bacterium]